MDPAIQQIQEHIKDKKFFTARWLAYLSAESGLEPVLIAQCLAGLVASYLVLGSQAHFLANLILVAYPLLVTYVYMDEKPSRDYLLIYWGCWGCLTIFDRILEHIPLYYLVKMCLLATLFLDPWCYCVPIKQYLKGSQEAKEDCHDLQSAKAAKQKSPPPEKPDMTKVAVVASEPPPVEAKNPSSTRTAILPVVSPKTDTANSTRTAIAPPAKPKSDYIGSEQSYQPAARVTSSMDLSGRKRFSAEENPMAQDRSYRLSVVSEGVSNREIGFAANLHDLVFRPMEKLIFNAPFDFNNITYHMKIKNTSHHRIAFAIKSNAIPRILAYPPSAIINPKQEMDIAVTLARFDISNTDVEKDRIVFEYILLKKSQDSITAFTHKLLEDAEVKRRKNIKIEYNP